MALRYLLRVRPAGVPSFEHAPEVLAPGFSLLYSSTQLTLACNRDDCWARFVDGRGLLVGFMFRRDDDDRFPAIAGGETVAIDPGAQSIHELLWGGFIAATATDDKIKIARDPSGLLPAYYACRDGVWYFASDASVLIESGIVSASVDWSRVGRALFANELPEEQTSLAGIRQLLPGTAIECLGSNAKTAIVWTPWTHTEMQPQPLDRLRGTILGCLGAWGRLFQRSLVGVSGGLDSSIVALGLRRSTDLNAVTISTHDAVGDESHYARTLCNHLDIPLAEARYSLDRVDIEKSSYAHCPRPGGRAQLQAYDAAMVEVACRLDAEAFFTGVGGDNIFQFTKSARPLVDRYLAEGIGRSLLATLSDICRLTGASASRVIQEAIKIPRTGQQKYFWMPDERFLSTDQIATASAEPLSHPWLEGSHDSLPGKAAHIVFLIRTQQYMDVHDRRWPTTTIHPLLSLPIIEACMAMPSWTACEGGVDRAYARRAFAADLPTEVLSRSIKGGPDGFAHEIIRRHIGRIRERLLDGQLVKRGIVDPSKIEIALREQQLAQGEDFVRILLLLDTEAWAQGWSG